MVENEHAVMAFTIGKTHLLQMQLLFLLALVTCAVIEVNWNVDWVENINPDGLATRRAIGVNSQWPIPGIEATIGDTLALTVHNSLNESVSIHFHGIFQNGTNYYDGALGITECGIAQGQEFTYNVKLDQMGSYWIHSHQRGQYPDGLRTWLVIHGQEHYNYEEEYVLALSDWYHLEHSVNIESFLSPENPDGLEPVPNSLIVNDKPNNTLNMTPGKTYRLRLIGMMTFASIDFWIDGHNMTIIETDGVSTQPFETSVLKIASAQRYSVLVTALNSTSSNYLAHFSLNEDMFQLFPEVYRQQTTALLSYSNDSPTFVTDVVPDASLFEEMNIGPLAVEAPLITTFSKRLDVIFNLFTDDLNHGTFNNSVFEFPNVPTIFTALSTSDNATNPKVYGPWAQTTVLPYMEAVEVVIVSHDKEGAHPFHLHGHTFQVVAKSNRADFSYSKLYDPANRISNPLRRDTVILPKKGWIAIRFYTDNPGVWIFHCHIQWHVEAGLLAQFVEAPLEIQKQSPPSKMIENCKASGIQTFGNAAGYQDLVTFTGLKPSPHFRIS